MSLEFRHRLNVFYRVSESKMIMIHINVNTPYCFKQNSSRYCLDVSLIKFASGSIYGVYNVHVKRDFFFFK